MKNTKRCMVMAVVLTLVLNLLSGLTVFAADKRILRVPASLKLPLATQIESNEIDASEIAVQVLSLDVTIPKEATAGYTLEFIDTHTDYTVPYGFLRFRVETDETTGEATGVISTYQKAEDPDYGNSATLDSGTYDKKNVSFTPGEAFNLTARLNKKTGTVDYYMNSTWFYRQVYDESKKTADLPIGVWYVALVYSEEGNATPTVAVNYDIGLEDDVVGASISNVDESKKTITVNFTEKVTGDLAKTQLKCVNGGKELTISNAAVSGSSVTFTYTGNLAAGNEYALILPEDVKGAKYGNGLDSNYLYFVSNSLTVNVNQTADFEGTYAADTNFRLKEVNGDVVTTQTTESGGKSGEGLLVKSGTVQKDTSTMYWQNYNYDIWTSDTQAVRFHIKPLRDGLRAAIRFADGGTNTIPLTVGFSNGKLFAGYLWDNIGAETEPQGDTYTTGTWYDVKVAWNSADKTGSIQITPDGGTMIEKTFTAASFGKISAITTVVYKNLMGIKTTDNQELFVLDNVKFYGMKNSAGINQVRFNDTKGNTIGAFDKLSSPLSSVNVTFSDAMNLTNAASNEIKLYYGADEVAYTATYDTETNCYSMTPTTTTVAEPGKNYKVAITGIKTVAGSAIANYSCYVETDIYTFIDASVALVDGSGEAVETIALNTDYTVNATFKSTATGVTSIPVIIAQYTEENEMKSASIETISADKNITLNITDSAITSVGIYAWDSLETILPLCEAIRVPVEAQE